MPPRATPTTSSRPRLRGKSQTITNLIGEALACGRSVPSLMRTALTALLLAIACGDGPEITPPERDPTVNGNWSGTVGPITVRYSLNEADGTITDNLEFVVVNLVEGSGSVRGSRVGQRIELRADDADFVELVLDAQLTGSATFGGTQFGDQIAGEFDFQGTGTDPESGRPFAVEIRPGPAPLTLVRVRR